ncbi:MAG: hypothetical protein QOI98_1701 [Solirubrobacteraceae bacterium]|nr:hypothetical protein [Solirubrobacteraceae bacterium]
MSVLAERTARPADAALWPGPWPAEDGGPLRAQEPRGLSGLGIAAGERLEVAAVRDALATTMVILRAPGEVFVLRHTLGRRPLSDPSSAWVERVDPVTLATLARSPDLPAGPFWPGGMAAHANGSLHVVAGNHCHRLSPDLEVLATLRLPGSRPYNSFVVLPDGTLVMKDFDRELREPAKLVLLDPDTLERRCEDVDLGEAAIARLSADGDDLYVVGARNVFRLRWDGTRLERDAGWGARYLLPGQSYGWDPVVAGGQLWFMDNGAHDYVTTMQGAGVAAGPVHLFRLSLSDPEDVECVEVCGAARGAVTDPPLYDAGRRIAVAYDSANGVVQAFRFGARLEPLWRRELAHAAHMIFYADTGELVLHDFRGPAIGRTRLGRAVSRRATAVMRRPALRRLATRGSRDEVVVVDIETGAERGRAVVPSLMQSVVFPAPGFERDLYWCTMTTLARVAVT